MGIEDIWLIGKTGRPIPLKKDEDGAFREAITAKNIFTNTRYVLDLRSATKAREIAPYHFRSNIGMAAMLSIAAGILLATFYDLNGYVAAGLFAIASPMMLLFKLGEASQYLLIEFTLKTKSVLCVIQQEDLETLRDSIKIEFEGPTRTVPRNVNEKEKLQISIQRYSLVTTISSAGMFVLIGSMLDFSRGQIEPIVGLFSMAAFCMLLVISLTGATKILSTASHLKRLKTAIPND